MGLHTVCPSIIQSCSNEEYSYYYTNILLVYTQNNPHKICLDKGGIILKEYGNIANKSEFIRLWIKLITNDKTPSIEYISLPQKDELFDIILEVCKQSYDKILIVESKQECTLYYDFITNNGVNVFDKDEIINHLNNGNNIKIEAKNGGQISFGNGSPNIKNNKNE